MSDYTSAMDQLLAALPDMARATGGYFNGLIAEGLTREEALALTMTWLSTLLAGRSDA